MCPYTYIIFYVKWPNLVNITPSLKKSFYTNCLDSYNFNYAKFDYISSKINSNLFAHSHWPNMRSNVRSIWAQLEEDKDIYFFLFGRRWNRQSTYHPIIAANVSDTSKYWNYRTPDLRHKSFYGRNYCRTCSKLARLSLTGTFTLHI
jgi:hypothetical protein